MKQTNYYIISIFAILIITSVVMFGIFLSYIWQPLIYLYIAIVTGTAAYAMTKYEIKKT